jgi:hypothetical protein
MNTDEFEEYIVNHCRNVSILPVYKKIVNHNMQNGVDHYLKFSNNYDTKKNMLIPAIIDNHYIALVIKANRPNVAFFLDSMLHTDSSITRKEIMLFYLQAIRGKMGI